MVSKDYIAGFIDGEGYLGVRKHTHPSCIRGFRYQVVVKVAQKRSADKILYILQQKYGGNISFRKEQGNANASTMWEITSMKLVRVFIADIGERLVVKSEQVQVIKDYLELGKVTTRKAICKEKMDVLYLEREKLYKKIKELNHRGLAETK